MDIEINTIFSTIIQIFFLSFMAGSGIWIALDAKKHQRPPSEYITWGLFGGSFIFLGLIIYLLWRRYIFFHEE
ncbi:MAG: hypothetical protein K9L17_11235 [Clostridiales bacterium]|nr:hypothetical protein [Clostridiales bacterium]MCF8023255.1 hypothetical protein [Clostridiales bacterium]